VVEGSKNRQALAWVDFYACPGLLFSDARSESLFLRLEQSSISEKELGFLF